jgi:hypothetical protein
MSKLLMKTLSADLPALAELIRSQGRGKDTVLAHITPQEAALLKKRGGSGTMNPATGLPEFQEYYGFDVPDPGAELQTITQFPDYYPQSFEAQGDPDLLRPTQYRFGSAPEGVREQTRFSPSGLAFAEPVTERGRDITSTFGETGSTEFGEGRYGGPAPTAQEYFQGIPQSQYKSIDPFELAAAGISKPPGFDEAVAPSKNILDRLGITEKDAARLGLGALLTGGLTAQNLSRTRQAQQQAEASREELARLGRPYQQTGAQLQSAAQRGELSPVNRQILNAARAQLQQGVATRGGVGAAQAQNQIADLTQRLVQNQFDLGLRISNIGDQYIQGAIRTGLQADQAINAANQNFYTQLASMAAPFILGQQPVYQVTTPVRRG